MQRTGEDLQHVGVKLALVGELVQAKRTGDIVGTNQPVDFHTSSDEVQSACTIGSWESKGFSGAFAAEEPRKTLKRCTRPWSDFFM